MITFEQFVASLVDSAKLYTPDELQQLHVDVQRFAQVIIAVYRSREKRDADGSPHPRIDAAGHDRTVEGDPHAP